MREYGSENRVEECIGARNNSEDESGGLEIPMTGRREEEGKVTTPTT